MPTYNIRVFGKQTSIETQEAIGTQLSRRLQTGTPKTYAESGGSKQKFSWDGQQITRSELQEVKQIRESGGLIARLVHAKALLTFGTGVEFHVEENEETAQLIDGEERTLEEWLLDTFNDINELVLDVGEDGIWYPYGAVETVETRAGDFSHIEPIEPWTIIPETDERGRITAWEQEIKSGMGTYSEVFDPEDITHFVINKSSARDKTGISEVLRSKQEIEAYRRNQDAMRNAIEMHGFPEWHVQAGVSGASPVDDQDLRMIINMIERTSSEGDTVTATGPDVEFNRLDPGDIKLQEITSNDLQKLALALGVPIEAVDFGSEGLGSGEQSKVRRAILELDIQATQRAYMNQWVTKLIRPIIKDYSPFDHTHNLEMRLQDPLTSVTDMAELINQVGEYMETNEAREKLDLPKKDDLEGEYGAPGDGDDDPMGGFFSEQVNKELDKRDLSDSESVVRLIAEFLQDFDGSGESSPNISDMQEWIQGTDRTEADAAVEFASVVDSFKESNPDIDIGQATVQDLMGWMEGRDLPGGDTDFSERRAQVPDNANPIESPDECNGSVVEGPRGGLYCVPDGADGAGDGGGASNRGGNPNPSVDLDTEVDSMSLEDAGIVDGSNHAGMRIAQLEDGGEVFVEEDYEDWIADKELAGVSVYESLGVPIPDHHYYEDTNEMAKEGVTGRTLNDAMRGEEIENVDEESVIDAFAASLIAGDADMHGGNMMIRDDGTAVPIDVEGSGGPVREKSDKESKVNAMLERGGLDVEYDDIWDRAQEMAGEIDADSIPDGETDMGGMAANNIRDNIEAIQ